VSTYKTAKVLMVYGESGLYKTTNLKFAAQWLYEQSHGKPVYLVSGEASTRKIFEPLEQLDIVRAAYIQGAKAPLPAIRHFIQGEWWRNGKWERIPEAGGFLFEGLTTFAEIIMEDLREKQRQIGQDVVGKFSEGCSCGAGDDAPTLKHKPDCAIQKFANAAQSHYNFVQMEMLRNLTVSASLPAPYVIWTAHEAASEEEDTRTPIRGPAMVGKKKVDKIQKYVSTLIHAESYATKEGEKADAVLKSDVRYWFQRHPDPKFNNIEYPAKTTIPSVNIPQLLKTFPQGWFAPTTEHGLDRFMAEEARLSDAHAQGLQQWKDSILNQSKQGAK
jgi:hypothetical protein